MSVIFNQVLILIIFIVTGFVLGKTNITKSEHSQILSSLLAYVFLPCNIFKTFFKNFNIQYIKSHYNLLLVSIIIILLLLVVTHLLAKLFSKDKYERYIYEYSLLVPNYGYMGYALAYSLLGESGLMNIMAFALPTSFYIYTIGFAKLTKRRLSIKKLCNPVIVTTVLGIIAGLFCVRIPNVFINIIEMASNCLAPVSMLLTGIVVSKFTLKSILCNANNYFLVILRLIIIPVLFGLILNVFFEKYLVQTVVLFYALPCGLNTVVFPRLINENCEIGANLALLSTFFSIVTLPVILSLFGIGGYYFGG